MIIYYLHDYDDLEKIFNQNNIKFLIISTSINYTDIINLLVSEIINQVLIFSPYSSPNHLLVILNTYTINLHIIIFFFNRIS